VQNAASAQIKGIETNLEWVPGGGWTFDASATYIDAKLTSNFCGTYVPGTVQLITNCPNQINGGPNSNGLYFADGTVTTGPLAPSGTHLPVVPAFKGNAIARYSFPLEKMDASVQLAYVHQSSSTALLFPVFQEHLGNLPAYNLFDFSASLQEGHSILQFYVTNIFDERAELTRFAACTPTTCSQPYVIPTQPRTIAVKFGQKF
jgi:outer membrane receptor protein involved in Fe transport